MVMMMMVVMMMMMMMVMNRSVMPYAAQNKSRATAGLIYGEGALGGNV